MLRVRVKTLDSCLMKFAVVAVCALALALAPTHAMAQARCEGIFEDHSITDLGRMDLRSENERREFSARLREWSPVRHFDLQQRIMQHMTRETDFIFSGSKDKQFAFKKLIEQHDQLTIDDPRGRPARGKFWQQIFEALDQKHPDWQNTIPQVALEIARTMMHVYEKEDFGRRNAFRRNDRWPFRPSGAPSNKLYQALRLQMDSPIVVQAALETLRDARENPELADIALFKILKSFEPTAGKLPPVPHEDVPVYFPPRERLKMRQEFVNALMAVEKTEKELPQRILEKDFEAAWEKWKAEEQTFGSDNAQINPISLSARMTELGALLQAFGKLELPNGESYRNIMNRREVMTPERQQDLQDSVARRMQQLALMQKELQWIHDDIGFAIQRIDQRRNTTGVDAQTLTALAMERTTLVSFAQTLPTLENLLAMQSDYVTVFSISASAGDKVIQGLSKTLEDGKTGFLRRTWNRVRDAFPRQQQGNL